MNYHLRMQNQDFHDGLMQKHLLLHVLTSGGVITLTADPNKRSQISSHIMHCMETGTLCIFNDNLGVPNAVCRGKQIIGFYFDQKEPNKEQQPTNFLDLSRRNLWSN